MKISLLDVVILGAVGGATYHLLKPKPKQAVQAALNPMPEVKKLIKQVKAGPKKTARRPAPRRATILTDRSDSGRRVATENPDGSMSHHRVGRGVKSA